MSVFIVSKAHIDALADYAASMEYKPEVIQKEISWRGSIGQTLVKQNYASFNNYYLGENEEPYIYQPEPPKRTYAPVEIIKACLWYDDMASESHEYPLTVACHIIQAIRADAISHLPGYDEAEFEID